jgi:CBS domain-containing protein
MAESPKSSRDPNYINSAVSFVNQDTLIQEVVEEMIAKGISSILVEDNNGLIVGIVTERDIVRKFTLLNIEDKLTRNVSTIMTRPVAFVQVKDFHKQIVKLHLEKRIRHFPILSSLEPKKENLVGIVSITDVARNYMLAEMGKLPKPAAAAPIVPAKKVVVGVLARTRQLVNTYIEIFGGLGFDAQEVTDLGKFATSPNAPHSALILDLDGYSDQQVHDLLPIAVKAKFYLILTTSQPNMLPIFKKYIDKTHQEIATKPLDLSYVSWLLHNKWTVDQEK